MEGRMYPAIRFFSAEDPAITALRQPVSGAQDSQTSIKCDRKLLSRGNNRFGQNRQIPVVSDTKT
jgi:hypothetical protein